MPHLAPRRLQPGLPCPGTPSFGCDDHTACSRTRPRGVFFTGLRRCSQHNSAKMVKVRGLHGAGAVVLRGVCGMHLGVDGLDCGCNVMWGTGRACLPLRAAACLPSRKVACGRNLTAASVPMRSSRSRRSVGGSGGTGGLEVIVVRACMPDCGRVGGSGAPPSACSGAGQPTLRSAEA